MPSGEERLDITVLDPKFTVFPVIVNFEPIIVTSVPKGPEVGVIALIIVVITLTGIEHDKVQQPHVVVLIYEHPCGGAAHSTRGLHCIGCGSIVTVSCVASDARVNEPTKPVAEIPFAF